MRIFILPVLGLLSLSACSTVSGVFGGGTSEDYNKLTSGDPHADWGGARAPVAVQHDGPSATAGGEDAEADRKTASIAETGQNDALDPTDDQARGKIENGRGLSVSQYARGDRATRADFFDQAPNDGSLWASDNDANYFYSKNKMRAMGDIVSIKIEDEMIRQIADEVKKSLTPAEQEVEMALYVKNNTGAKDDKDLQLYRNVASSDLKTSDAEVVKDNMEKSVRWSQVDLRKAIALTANEEFRGEIIDRYPNGNYKVRTVKRILYRGSSKLISMVAVAPAVDFDDKDLINSGKLYEYKVRVAR